MKIHSYIRVIELNNFINYVRVNGGNVERLIKEAGLKTDTIPSCGAFMRFEQICRVYEMAAEETNMEILVPIWQ